MLVLADEFNLVMRMLLHLLEVKGQIQVPGTDKWLLLLDFDCLPLKFKLSGRKQTKPPATILTKVARKWLAAVYTNLNTIQEIIKCSIVLH